MPKYQLVDGMKYRVTTCKVCGEEFATHPITYKAKVRKDICFDCFILRKEAIEPLIKERKMKLRDKIAPRLAYHADCEWQYMTEETKKSFTSIANDIISVLETHIKVVELPIGSTGNIQEACRRAMLRSLRND